MSVRSKFPGSREPSEKKTSTLFYYKKTLLDNQRATRYNTNNTQEVNNQAEALPQDRNTSLSKHEIGGDDSRSMRSEFDYTTKKKFTEMANTQGPFKPTRAKLAKLDNGIESQGGDKLRVFSKKSGISMRSNRGVNLGSGTSTAGHRSRLMNRTMDFYNRRGVEPIPESPAEDGEMSQ